MSLNERQIRILQAIIKNYLETAEPVGSRTISRRYDLGVSSATIRNEMSDLEELGFIIQPHTSAGRIPSDKGYRLYVDHLMHHTILSAEQIYIINKLLMDRVGKLDNLLKEISDLLAIMTNYTSIVTTPQYTKIKLKHMQLIPLDESSIVLVIVTDGNIVKNHIINIKSPIDVVKLETMSNLLNHHLQGLTIEDINLPLIQVIKKEMGVHGEILNDVLDAISETLQHSQDIEIYTSGTTNMFNFPEFNDIIKVKQLIDFLEHKDTVLSLLSSNEIIDNDESIKIVIGEENHVKELRDCSLITTTYKIGGITVGSIGILGPTRMDYGKVVSTLDFLIKQVDPLFNIKYYHKRE